MLALSTDFTCLSLKWVFSHLPTAQTLSKEKRQNLFNQILSGRGTRSETVKIQPSGKYISLSVKDFVLDACLVNLSCLPELKIGFVIFQHHKGEKTKMLESNTWVQIWKESHTGDKCEWPAFCEQSKYENISNYPKLLSLFWYQFVFMSSRSGNYWSDM